MDILPGAEPWSHRGSQAAVLCVHGFTGSPQSMHGLARSLAAAGYSVEVPRLPGHGTTIDDMQTTGWDDWLGEAEAAFARLAEQGLPLVVAGQSMGGTLALALALRHPDVTGVITVNPLAQPQPDEVLDALREMVVEGETMLPGIGSDIADPDATETAYPGVPLRPLLTLMDGVRALESQWSTVSCPLLIFTSAQDHVVEPAQSDFLARSVRGPVERVSLERSYHVATLDYDKDLIFERSVEFVRKVAVVHS